MSIAAKEQSKEQRKEQSEEQSEEQNKARNISQVTDVVVDRTGDRTPQLDLVLGCTAVGKTVLKRRYMSYPLSVSPIFRLDEQSSQPKEPLNDVSEAERTGRAYLYRMNTSPGLLAGDTLSLALRLEAGSSLLLADQAATKVHTMPTEGPLEKRLAKVHYRIEVGDRATLEFLPEPLILFADSTLHQSTHIRLHPSAGLSWGEIILPGRLARGERYQFREYWSRLQLHALRAPESTAVPLTAVPLTIEQAWFVETMKLLGKHNPFAHSELFASGSILGTLILVLPEAIATTENLSALSQQLDALTGPSDSLTLASSILPGGKGLFVRAIAQTTRELQAAFKAAANHVRHLRKQPPLPYSL